MVEDGQLLMRVVTSSVGFEHMTPYPEDRLPIQYTMGTSTVLNPASKDKVRLLPSLEAVKDYFLDRTLSS